MTAVNAFGRILRRNVSTTTIFSHPPPNISAKQMKRLSTTDLLIKLGYIAQPNAGLTNWLPLGNEVLKSVEQVIRKRHEEEGCVEVSLSSLSNEDIWSKTGRWNNNELFKIDDKFCLAATAEEEITSLVAQYLQTYKKLPFIGFQITRKYRNEIRSRGGLLRGREFVMKDAYSFDSSKENALTSFKKVNSIYEKIFSNLKLPYVKANADSGDIGGDLSYEWHILNDIGEDKLLKCTECGACSNVEKVHPLKEENMFVNESDVRYFLNNDDELICIYFPKGRTLSMKFVKEEDLVEINERKATGEKALAIFNEQNELNDNLMTVYRLIDINVGPGTLMPDLPVTFSKNHMISFQGLDLTEAQDGDTCGSCESGKLSEMKGIEVGHTFYLGTKYSQPLDAEFTDINNDKKYFEMGCYGIGVSRIVGVIAETLKDDQGLRWPANIAPIQVSIIANNTEKDDICNDLKSRLVNAGLKVEFDSSSDIGFGKKLLKSKMLGIPLQVIVGKSYPVIEIEIRGYQFSKSHEDLLRNHSEEWSWVVEGDKHKVPVEHSDKVIKALLDDL